MSIMDAAEAVKVLYRTPNEAFSSIDEVERKWSAALSDFITAMDHEDAPDVLENCVLSDKNWELPVNERLLLLEKAKTLGSRSRSFLLDYFGYLASHLDPGVQKDAAREELERLLDREA